MSDSVIVNGQFQDSIRTQLQKVLTSRSFADSDRMQRFLRLTAELALEGRSAEIKEYLIGLEVFDRGAGLDPRNDSIVRVEARRLRDKLRDYYETDGRHDPLVIQFDRGRPVVGRTSAYQFRNATSDIREIGRR